MPIRFRRILKLGPLIRIAANGKSLSLRAGPPGLGATVNTRGEKRVSAGIPGSGLHATKSIGTKRRRRGAQEAAGAPVTFAGVLRFVAWSALVCGVLAAWLFVVTR